MIILYNSTNITEDYTYQEIIHARISPRALARISDPFDRPRLGW